MAKIPEIKLVGLPTNKEAMRTVRAENKDTGAVILGYFHGYGLLEGNSILIIEDESGFLHYARIDSKIKFFK